MAYHEHPEPDKLYTAFKFGTTTKEIARLGSRTLVIAFFGSVFRADSTIIEEFYEKVKNTKSANLHYGFLGSLWMANTTYSNLVLNEYIHSAYAKKFKSSEMSKERPFNVYLDSITVTSQLDAIWADFFATGNSSNIKRIISTLRFSNQISQAAQWSLISNGIRYKKVNSIIKSESRENMSDIIKDKLSLIIKTVDEKLQNSNR